MPTVVLPKIAVVSPTRNRLRPQVASMVSIMRPYRKRMIVRSTITPMMPTTTGATTSIDKPDVDAVAGGDDRGIAAEHQEFAMGEIDDPHHAEDDRQPDADQRQAGYRVKDLDCQESNEIHVHLSQARLTDPAGLQILITYCWLSFGFLIRSHTAAVSAGFCCAKSSSTLSFLSLTSAI